jgi:Tol biopolymer transport system component
MYKILNRLNINIFYTIILISFLGLLSKARAQYFGQNKVNYDDFSFKILHTEHFDIYFYPEEAGAVKYAARLAERWYARHAAVFDDSLIGKQKIIFYDGFPQFAETNVTQGMIGQGTGGFTEPYMRRIVIPFAGPLPETDHVIGHELTHAFQFDVTSKSAKKTDGLPAASQMPLWFIEGMAEYFSIGPKDPNTAMWMREASLKKLPDISDLDNPKYFPYRYGESLLAFMGSKYGNEIIPKLLRVASKMQNMKYAIDTVFHISADSLSKQWHEALHAAYDSLKSLTDKPEKYGPQLITKEKGGGDMNISPVISPDGKYVIFFSTKDLFGMDLYLADAKTGKIIKNIYKTELNTHLQNLEFINSAGAWNPDGKQFVFSGVNDGRPVLSILNVDNDKISREIRFPNIAEIFNPAWSPDGRYIAFSALADGLSNLFMYDLKEDSLIQLTNDPYSELQPAWSPDGKKLVFITDRFTTKLSDLDFGNYGLAVMNMENKSIDCLKDFPDGKNINPQWSHDGKTLFFISDHNGIDNIYKLDLANDSIHQVTNLFGGVSGITALSPALSVAQNTNKLVYSVYRNDKYDIYLIDSSSTLGGMKPEKEFATGNPAILPLKPNLTKPFYANLYNPNIGLPADSDQFEITNYHPSLSLIGFGQPSLVAGVDPLGTYVGGGIALFWSDVLGNHNLATALQIQSGNGLTNISGLVGYMNSSHRLNWGGVVQQIPYLLEYYSAGYGTINNTPAYIQQDIVQREIDREISGILAYPFSQEMRVELSAGYTNISFDEEITTQALSLIDGSVLLNQNDQGPHPTGLNLASLGAALVYDNSLFGATSPILGNRFRVEVDPYVGTLNWIAFLADFRQYWMPVRPFTLAARILHYGRYGKDADDYRLSPEYLGYPGLIRGYDNSSYTSDQLFGNYPSYDQLFGSKILVGNLELRFPLLGVFGLGDGYYGYFPIEFAAFYDAGFAWYNLQKLSIFGGNRKPVTSYGIAFRVNLFGYAVGEVDYARPLNRPGTKWIWQFNLTEGF